jgi:hypothetical protein
MAEYYVTVLWGETPMKGDTPATYEFCTKDERACFSYGIEEAIGWNNCEWIVHDKPKKFKLTDFDNYEEEEEE